MNSATIERSHLKALLAAVIDPARAADLPDGDATLIAVARHHRLTPLLSITAGDRLPSKLFEQFRRDRIITAARSMMLGQAAEECVSAFAQAGIRTIVLKGLAYEATLYRTAGARPTADVDLLIPDADRRRAFAVLDRLGFEPRAAAPGFDDPDYHEVAWSRPGVEVDLHMALAPLARCEIDYAAVWRAAEPLRIGQTDTLTLSRPHAAVFQALHMAIDHFGVPAIYLVDLARLLDGPHVAMAADEAARRWRCRRPLMTALALLDAVLPVRAGWPPAKVPGRARRIIEAYGPTAPLPRTEQFIRKFSHFDGPREALRYLEVQSRRNIREQLERRFRKRTARARLAL